MVQQGIIIGIKDSSQNEKLLQEWKKISPHSLLFVGEDTLIYYGVVESGAHAVIAGSANLYPNEVMKTFTDALKHIDEGQLVLNRKVKDLLSRGNFIGELKKGLKEKSVIASDFRRVE